MKTVRSQSILDIAVERYGTVDAVPELMALNELSGKYDNPAYVSAGEVDLAFSLNADVEIVSDSTSTLVNKKALQEMGGIRIATGIKSNYRVFNNVFSKIFH